MKKILLSFITLGMLIGCEKSDSCDEARAIYSEIVILLIH